MLKIDKLTKRFGEKTAVDGISFELRAGEITGFIGPNGAGNTTTIEMITGIQKPDEGDIAICGHDLYKEPLAAKKCFGYVSDTPDMFLRLTGMEYLNFIGDVFEVPVEDRKRLIEKYAPKLGIMDNLSETILNYSHGMRQKIVILSALIHSPKILILDEPLVGLDPSSAYELKGIMREYTAAGGTVFFSTHILEIAQKLCHRILIIKKGSIIYDGTCESLMADYPHCDGLEKIYLELMSDE